MVVRIIMRRDRKNNINKKNRKQKMKNKGRAKRFVIAAERGGGDADLVVVLVLAGQAASLQKHLQEPTIQRRAHALVP